MHDRRGSNHEAYLWQYGQPGADTVFDFCLGRGREGPRKFLDKCADSDEGNRYSEVKKIKEQPRQRWQHQCG
jgi:hypothetical protein